MPEGVWQKNQGCLLFLFLSLLFFIFPSLLLNTSQFLSSSPFLHSASRSHTAAVVLKAGAHRASWISPCFLSALSHFKSPVPRTLSELRVWKVKPLSGENKHITWSELVWPHSRPQTCWWSDTISHPLPRFPSFSTVSKKLNTFLSPQTKPASEH